MQWTSKAKLELANAIIDTINCHEQSWVNEDRPRLGRYQCPWEECAADEVEDEWLRPLVVAMVQAGYVEFAQHGRRGTILNAIRPARAVPEDIAVLDILEQRISHE